ncbi:MAG TPA: serine hydrolase domain-containing protein [Pirellulaceae bacterium]|nr:serine hydrolase domain-containing protein [Pirellulaceae bacterium]
MLQSFPQFGAFALCAWMIVAGILHGEEGMPEGADIEFPITGGAVADLAPLDAWMKEIMAEHKIPGGSLAVVKDGKLVYARGFGYADREAKTPVQPESLFRIASVSKPITAVAIMKLAEQGKLKLDDKVLDYIDAEPFLAEDRKIDERWQQVTLAHCLTHTGGWDRGVSYDPMFQALRMSREMKVPLPIEPLHIIRYQRGMPLDFDPGSRYAYSNFGYSLLGRVIEKVSGKSYEQYVKDEVFAPLGISSPRIGRSLASERAEGEVNYYVVNDGTGVAVTGPAGGNEDEKVPVSYGVWRQETLDAHGGWIASTIDLAKFGAALDVVEDGKATRGKLLSASSVKEIFSPRIEMKNPEGKVTGHYGSGWMLKKDAALDDYAAHGGALACTAASLIHFDDGLNVAVLFNLGQSADGKTFLAREVEAGLLEAVAKTRP